ncbi:PHD-type domain-containing protein [Abeliophyllum distichum]|uniref:PHD-type domain-containing protein n=1 Tax=Abeliophyllum distichum TaxID=126358 RepID=A0ABD1V744_9LAMI
MGFPRRLQSDKGMAKFLEKMGGVEQFLNDPWLIKARENATVQVMVSKVVVTPHPPLLLLLKFLVVGVGGVSDFISSIFRKYTDRTRGGDGNEWGEEELATTSAQVKNGVAEAGGCCINGG